MRFGDLRHYCGISVKLGGVQYDVGLHGAVQCSCGHLREERGEAASEGCGKKFPPSDCKKLSILLFTTWQLIEIDNALHCFTFTRNLLLTFVFCPTYSTALGFSNLDIYRRCYKTALNHFGRVSQCQFGDKKTLVLCAFQG